MATRLVPLTEAPTIVLDKPILLVGRHPDCDVLLDSKKVSRRHCCLAHVNGRLIVRDLGSTNGVWVNGQRVGEGEMNPGDELAIANIPYQLRCDDDSPREEAQNGSSAEPQSPLPADEDDVQLAPDD